MRLFFSTQEVGAGGLEIQSCLWVHSNFEDRLSYLSQKIAHCYSHRTFLAEWRHSSQLFVAGVGVVGGCVKDTGALRKNPESAW